MLPLKKILCPCDFSDASKAGLAVAAEIAERRQVELYLLHVVPVVPLPAPDPNFVLAVPEYELALHAQAERQLEAAARDLKDRGVVVHTRVGHGDAGSEIVRVAQAEKVDLIVIATHGATGWQRMVIGSVAAKVVRLAHTPVLTIPAPVQHAAGAGAS